MSVRRKNLRTPLPIRAARVIKELNNIEALLTRDVITPERAALVNSIVVNRVLLSEFIIRKREEKS